MPLATLRQVLDEAARGGYGVGAFNVNNMEQLQGIVEAAVETNSPVIVQASRGAIAYAGSNYLRHLILAAGSNGANGQAGFSYSCGEQRGRRSSSMLGPGSSDRVAQTGRSVMKSPAA